MESKLEAVMALAALLQVFCFIDFVVNASSIYFIFQVNYMLHRL